MATIVESNAAGSFLQLKELARRTGERIALTIDSGALFHCCLHLLTKRGNTLPASGLLEELVLQPCLLVQRLGERMAAVWRLLPRRECCRGAPGPGPDHQQFRQ